ncbi:MAG: protease HtpX [Candidatus Gracilibacteria bacterium]|nr:protease HtpX [Candidatus Gracilibacteria bacterium]
MLKRIILWFGMNIAVIIVLTVVFSILEHYFGLKLDLYGTNYISILIYAAIIGFTGSFISLAISKWMAKKAYNITIITQDDYLNLDSKQKLVWDTVKNLSERNHINMPEVGIYSSNDPNAFATGMTKNSSLVAVSTGLLSAMDNGAIEGVVGHEMAHILNGDMVTMTLLQGVLNTFVVFFARIVANLISNSVDEKLSPLVYMLVNILLQILFGILASLVAMKFSRYREFRADEGSARFLGKEKMIAGLEALKKMQSIASSDDSKLATMKISTKGKSGFMAMFSSHPDLDDRINALKAMNI